MNPYEELPTENAEELQPTERRGLDLGSLIISGGIHIVVLFTCVYVAFYAVNLIQTQARNSHTGLHQLSGAILLFTPVVPSVAGAIYLSLAVRSNLILHGLIYSTISPVIVSSTYGLYMAMMAGAGKMFIIWMFVIVYFGSALITFIVIAVSKSLFASPKTYDLNETLAHDGSEVPRSDRLLNGAVSMIKTYFRPPTR